MNSDFRKGDILGRYRIEELIGRGASGMVYRAFDTTLSAQIALKVLTLEDSEESIARFNREILVARQLTHPSICRVFDLHIEEGVRFLTMEFVAGRTLAAILEEEGVLEPERAVNIVRQLCRALLAGHKNNIVHRDLKPANVILDHKDRPKVLDFGLAKQLEDRRLTSPGVVVGTPRYMAPEVMAGRTASTQSDLFSLGAILYHCLTGRTPYDGESIGALIGAHQEQRPMPPERYNAAVSDALSAIVLAAVAPVPADRPDSVMVLEKRLGKVFATVPTRADGSVVSWHDDIEGTVSLMLTDPNVSALIQQKVKHLTVMFSDIAGITSFFDRKGDVAGRKRIYAHNKLLFPIIRVHRGVIIKTIGDAIMATFADAEDAVTAAIEMQRILSVSNSNSNTSMPTDDEPTEIRLGIHSGDAVVERKDVFGDTVNVAARICSKTEKNQILISQATQQLLRADSFALNQHMVTTLKGKRGDFRLFAVQWTDEDLGETVKLELAPEPRLHMHSSDDHNPVVPSVDETERMPLRKPSLKLTERPAEELPAQPEFPNESQWAYPTASTYAPNQGSRGSSTRWAAFAVGTALLLAAGWWLSRQSPDATDATGDVMGAQPDAVVTAEQRQEATTASNHREGAEQPIPKNPVERNDQTRPSQNRAKARARGQDKVAAQERCALIVAKMKSKGIVVGDHSGLDEAKLNAERLLNQRKYTDALAAADLAVAQVDNMRIDRTFVTAKMTRVSRLVESSPNEATKKRLTSLLDQVLTDFDSGRYIEANRGINRVLAVAKL